MTIPTGLLPPDRADWLRERMLHMPGWCYPDKAVRLAEVVVHAQAAISVDLGVFGARSTLALAEGHRTIGFGYVTGIDPWVAEATIEGTNDLINEQWWKDIDLEGIYRAAMAAMCRHAVLPHWQILREYSRDAVRHFADQSIGVLHQDSNHSPEVSQEELRLWMPKMQPGAFWIMDDTNWPSLQETQVILAEQHGAVMLEDHENWRIYQLP